MRPRGGRRRRRNRAVVVAAAAAAACALRADAVSPSTASSGSLSLAPFSHPGPGPTSSPGPAAFRRRAAAAAAAGSPGCAFAPPGRAPLRIRPPDDAATASTTIRRGGRYYRRCAHCFVGGSFPSGSTAVSRLGSSRASGDDGQGSSDTDGGGEVTIDRSGQPPPGASAPAAAAASSSIGGGGRYRIGPEQIAAVKSNAPIVDAIESYDLPHFRRTSATRATALCPFHDDHNPSLSIDSDRGMYKCFACGAGGDVFNFVREYRHLKDGGEKMSFRDAVEFVAREFTDGSVTIEPLAAMGGGEFNADDAAAMSVERRERLALEVKKCERLALANAAAADFYGRCLVTMPEAGAARSHLRSRGIDPGTVRKFALGYAPDRYFSKNVGARGAKRKRWGEGSVVERLKGLGFGAQELVEAGLATRTRKRGAGWRSGGQGDGSSSAPKRKKRAVDGNVTASTTSGANETGSELKSSDGGNDEDEDFSDLMDRFRGRLVVPIFDADGKTVIGFGGRHIDLPTGREDGRGDGGSEKKKEKKKESTSGFKPAKYLNSPESPIFRKKTILFGNHVARKAIDKAREEAAKSTLGSAPFGEKPSDCGGGKPALVIVEGYFDAIALSSAGIDEAVACMGTALTSEQLEVAARTAGAPGGKIVLCFDGDDAGLDAVERLCSGNALSKASEDGSADIYVATLPPGTKDPADFVQLRGGKAFRADVLDAARPWTDWYIDRIVSQYDGNATSTNSDGSFSDVCNRVSTFLSTFANPADRTRRAYAAAGTLSEALAGADETGGASASSLRIRLESDLLDMASRKAGTREALARRVEVAGGSSADDAGLIAKMSSGEAITDIITDGDSVSGRSPPVNGERKMGGTSSPRDANNSGRIQKFAPRRRADGRRFKRPTSKGERDRGNGRSEQKWRRRDNSRAAPPLTPHFAGFEFVNPSDAAWLGLNNERRTRKNYPALVAGGTMTEARMMKEAIEAGETYVNINENNDIVYFNSNAFHGNKFITREAREAGYGKEGVTYDGSHIGMGVPALVQQDANQMLLHAEDRLLRALAEFPSARMAMKGAVAANIQSDAGTGPALIEWSTSDKGWLFECLTDSPGRAPLPPELQEGGTIMQLRHHLASRPDAPPGAFGVLSGKKPCDSPTRDDLTAEAKSADTIEEPDNMEGKNITAGRIVDNDNVGHTDESLDERDHSMSAFEDAETFAASFDPSFITDDVEQDISMESSDMGTCALDPFESPPSNDAAKDAMEGTLDPFFSSEGAFPSETSLDSISRDTRAELTVQETLAVILKATALHRMQLIKRRWGMAARALEKRTGSSSEKPGKEADNEIYGNNFHVEQDLNTEELVQYESMDLIELRALCENLGERLSEAFKTVHELDVSAKRIGSRLMDHCSSDGVEFRLSEAKHEQLSKLLDDHLASLPEDKRPETPGDDGDYVFGSDAFDEDVDPTFGGKPYIAPGEHTSRYEGLEDVTNTTSGASKLIESFEQFFN